MTLYTALPLEFVLDGIDQIKPTVQIDAFGIKMEVMPVSPGVGQIVRLQQCSLDDYLNPALAPGSLIQYQSQNQTSI